MKYTFTSLLSTFFCIIFIGIFSGTTKAQTVTAIPSACDGTNNQYTLTGTVDWGSMPATGQMIISVDGEGTVIKNATFAASVGYSIPGLNADGTLKTVNVRFTSSSTTFTQNYTAPVACVVNTCATGTAGSESYNYSFPTQLDDFTNATTTIPQFNTMGGTRTLQKVLITTQNTLVTNFIAENRGVSAANVKVNVNTVFNINLGNAATGTQIFNTPVSTNSANLPIGAAVNLLASANYSGDESSSTLNGLLAYTPNWKTAMQSFSDPRTALNWITALTGNASDDADIRYYPSATISQSGSALLSGGLDDYLGSGSLPITLTTTQGVSVAGGGGNTIAYGVSNVSVALKITYYYCATSVMPLTLLTFDGAASGNYNNLKWTTAQSYDVNKFSIERSANGINFNTIGDIAAINTSLQQEYNFKDNSTGNSDKWFYRLKIIDNNGSYKYSAIIVLKNGKVTSGFGVYPNPATDKIFINASKKINRLEIINSTGTIVNSKTNINLTDPVLISTLSPGIYFAKAYTADEVLVSKFIKE
ncbi:MAG: T9SS type A sorting domain-containing protein [Ferruginibacter sp.]